MWFEECCSLIQVKMSLTLRLMHHSKSPCFSTLSFDFCVNQTLSHQVIALFPVHVIYCCVQWFYRQLEFLFLFKFWSYAGLKSLFTISTHLSCLLVCRFNVNSQI